MNNNNNVMDFDMEIKNLLENIEKIKADVDLYGKIVEEQVLVSV